MKNKLKIISLFTAVSLWIYVMVVVNPQSTLSMEGVPVSVSNTFELSENNLLLSTDNKLTTNITLIGKIADLKKVKKENIKANIEIQNPAEGRNEATLNISVPDSISYKLDSSTIIAYLDKSISKESAIKIELPNGYDISDYVIYSSISKVNISGKRDVVKKVDCVIANIDKTSFELNKNIGIQLKPVDSKGNIVEGISLESTIMQVEIRDREEKEVNVVPLLKNGQSNKEINVSPNKITIVSDSETLSNINEVTTKEIDLNKLKKEGKISIDLELPNNTFVKGNNDNNLNKVQISISN